MVNLLRMQLLAISCLCIISLKHVPEASLELVVLLHNEDGLCYFALELFVDGGCDGPDWAHSG